MNVVRSLPRPAVCLVLDPRAPVPPGPWETLPRGDVDVVLAPSVRLPPGGDALDAVERAVRRGATDLVLCVDAASRVPAWAVGLVDTPEAHLRTQLARALAAPTIAQAVRRGLRVHAWLHDRAAGVVRVVELGDLRPALAEVAAS